MARRRGSEVIRGAGQTNLVRIIGGIHRGRKLRFPPVPGLRPTPDAVRETLFNWLQPIIPGAVCLDLFAGSGALGLEAVSRGASRVVSVDRSTQVVQQIRENAALLRLEQVEVVRAEVLEWLENTPPRPFNVVFADPPYADDSLDTCCALLAQRGWLSPEASIYLEAGSDAVLSKPLKIWQQTHVKRAGRVCYSLFFNG
ncbi:MAG: 16S rRNA (guanine(966)-N(2))-methyltransferase RsmD [Gammaproteobacteria bacterium]|nr:16S rRNA (guanine(966)-N(2))-methyltransferase RsmD [Gammaproteobacteria bacterium]